MARRLSVQHIELDDLFWQPGWVESDLQTFRERVNEALVAESWVVDGNYSKVRDVVWPKATLIVWLDYPLWLVLWRTLRRTLRRVTFREKLWDSANRETVANAFFSKDSLFVWQLQTHHARRRRYAEALSGDEWPHLEVIRLRSPSETRAWLEKFEKLGEPNEQPGS